MQLRTRGLPDLRFELPSYFMAMSFRCHRKIVSGVTMLQHVDSSLRPSAFPLAAKRRRWSSFNRSRFFPRSSRRTRFSSLIYSMTTLCSRFIQPARAMRMICHGLKSMRSILRGMAGQREMSRTELHP